MFFIYSRPVTKSDFNIKCQSHVHCSSWSCEVRLRLSAPSSVMHNGAGILCSETEQCSAVYSKSNIKIEITICNKAI